MEKIKIIDRCITALKITSEDEWLDRHIRMRGNSVASSPQYEYLQGYPFWLIDWMEFRNLKTAYIAKPLMKVLKSLIEEGQKEPIKIYKDMRINTGHKRAACMMFLGYSKIKAIIVPDEYKL